jgi:hypothetical protein
MPRPGGKASAETGTDDDDDDDAHERCVIRLRPCGWRVGGVCQEPVPSPRHNDGDRDPDFTEIYLRFGEPVSLIMMMATEILT